MDPLKTLCQELAARIEALAERQATLLIQAEAADLADEGRAKILAEFDKLQVEKEKAQAAFKRAELVLRDHRAVNQLPATLPITDVPAGQDEIDPEPLIARFRIPARARRHSQLVAYRGREREAYAAGLWFAGVFCAHPADYEFSSHCRTRAREIGLDFVSDPNSAGGVQANLTGLSNQSGGFFVPTVIETTIIELTLAYGVLRRLAEVVPMSSDSQTTPRWSAAMKAYWIGRGNKPTSSDPAWNVVQLIARDLGAMTKIGRQLSEDSLIDLGEKVTANIARAFVLAEDDAGFNGDGTSTYGGISGLLTALALAANAACVITATGSATVPALTNANFLKVAGSAPHYPGANWAWLCHKQVWSQSMAALQLAGGGNRVDEIAGGGRMAYLGYLVEFVNVMPSAPTTGQLAVLFADLSMAVKLGDRRGRTVQTGYENDDFTRQLMTILGTQRVDVNVHTVVDPLGDANTVGGPVMALKLG